MGYRPRLQMVERWKYHAGVAPMAIRRVQMFQQWYAETQELLQTVQEEDAEHYDRRRVPTVS